MKKTAADKAEEELKAKCHAYATWQSKGFFGRMRHFYTTEGGISKSERESIYTAFYQQGRARFDKSQTRP